MRIQPERNIKRVIEPWGYVENILQGQTVEFEYELVTDSAGEILWPIISPLPKGDLMVDIPDVDLVVKIDGKSIDSE